MEDMTKYYRDEYLTLDELKEGNDAADKCRARAELDMMQECLDNLEKLNPSVIDRDDLDDFILDLRELREKVRASQ